MSPRPRAGVPALLLFALGCGHPAAPAVRLAADAAPEDADLPPPLVGDACVRRAEICNQIDDDCDGLVDEADPDLRRALAEDPQRCGACGVVCEGAHARMTYRADQCLIAACEAGFNDRDRDPATGCESDCLVTNGAHERCDGLDNDCDGLIDEGFDLSSDLLHCGGCDQPCEIPPHAAARCAEGLCRRGACAPGFVDLDGDESNGCEYACAATERGREICNGLDDDCDGEIDEAAELEVPAELCGAVGACGPECRDGAGCAVGERCTDEGVCVLVEGGPEGAPCALDADCARVHPGYACLPRIRLDPGGLPRTERRCGPRPRRPICEGAEGFRCARGPNFQAGDERGRCDGVDNDCDGRVDEDFAEALLVGGPGGVPRTCEAGEGACRRSAVARCAEDGARVICEAHPAAPAATDDTCDGVDDDCDGRTDEDFQDAWISLGAVEIYAYEASRPGATDELPGLDLSPADGVSAFMETRPCSRSGVLPWAEVDFAGARAACAAIGARLCTGAEWGAACAGDSGRAFPYGATYEAAACNGGERDADPQQPGTQDAPLSCGALPTCEAGGVFDLSGNLKEWTEALVDGLRPVRGGGFTTNVPDGLACGQRGDVKPESFRSASLGFRCCRDLH